MHFQKPPHAEAKLVRCPRGAAYDVVVDLRSGSATYLQWNGFELTADNGSAIYVPEGFAHGFLTLVDDTELLYQISEFHHPESASGFRHDDPAFDIQWPGEIRVDNRHATPSLSGIFNREARPAHRALADSWDGIVSRS